MNIAYLNGEFIPTETATISILDRGFLFGDGVYEAIPVYRGRFFGLTEHLSRLSDSLKAIRLKPPLSHAEWEKILRELLARNDKTHESQSIYLQVTRGSEPVRNHLIPTNIPPTVFAVCLPPKNTSHDMLSGLSAITLPDRRRYDCQVKAINLLPNVLAYQEAHDQGCHEAIFIRDGQALEGTSSNLFVVKNGVLQTPALNPHILAGVTRSFILALAKKNKIPHQETIITESMLRDADEIWLTGSIKEIYPIVQLNHKPVGTGKVGALWTQMSQLYQAQIQSL